MRKEISKEVTFEELLERKNNYKGISPENQQKIQQVYDNIKDIERDFAQRVVLLSDYDCDGICSALIMKKIFPDAQVIIGDRFKDGYGVPSVVLQHGDMVICTDIGSSDIQKLTNIGMQTSIMPYVIDHHEKDEYIKDYEEIQPLKVLNFTGEKDAPDYCGTGLSMKLYECDYLRRISEGVPKESLERELNTVKVIGMIGTIADMVDVNNPFDENREIIKEGFDTLKAVFAGEKEIDDTLRLFLEVCKVDEEVKNLTTKLIGFNVSPPINALGRLESYGGQKAFDILSTPLFTEDGKVKKSVFDGIEHIKNTNQHRKDRMDEIMQTPSVKEAIERAKADDVNITVFVDKHIEQGLTGLVANKIKEATGKPAIVLTEGADGNYVGSGRNAEGYPNLYEYARNEHMLRGGGHADAIGLSVLPNKLEEYLQAVHDRYKDVEVVVEREYLKDFKNFTVENFLKLEPFGEDFPVPMIKTDAVKIEKKVGLPFKNPRPDWAFTEVDGVKFSDFSKAQNWHEGDVVHIVAQPNYSEFRGVHLDYQMIETQTGEIKELSKNDVNKPVQKTAGEIKE